MSTPESLARIDIDAALAAAGWAVQDAKAVNLCPLCNVAVRGFLLTARHSFADCLFFADAWALGVVESQSARQSERLRG